MSRSTENTGFHCTHCNKPVTNGSYHNHCPFCLHSLHVDFLPGNRQNTCRGLMSPVGIRNSKKGYQIVFRCCRCGSNGVNLVAENTIQPDDFNLLLSLMQAGCLVLR
ncbi:RNHCP domain-containing protein [candidate division TA06 bacterium]|uniref:RNHCP domain-containing protein n=1 Tax=candidate division TA06 bacterium TaxID=2250710 RepID=A0A933I9K2_UNCT6|nr:RNHCP domain-containing protein [candidate division TA06 bacterium]